ncbi:GyrI-like domain-containing protein [Paenibacillus sp. J2TS4]|uniref:GyrI-like domain-containing protein n=1 Tax=Paenibacillus sp. J2TS4 TaxID=2807194 RepID=UPI001B147E25|nr:GyrI-like domain-containing protein [Paenibacillus sp. J2TS4]GIP34515.1 DNA-binding protein [Paenibacillus sp. J2TS4]
MTTPRIISKGEIRFVGISARTSNPREASGEALIPGLWRRFYEERVADRIPHSLNPGVTYGIYTDYENGASGMYTLMIGCEAGSNEPVPEGMAACTVPASKYAVFTTERGEISKIVPRLWQEIWEWDRSHSRRSFTGDFEYYDARCQDPANAQVEIYIALNE